MVDGVAKTLAYFGYAYYAADREKAFVEFYLAPKSARAVEAVGYVPLPPATLLSVARRLDQNVTGSIFGRQGSVLGVTADTFQDDDKVKSAMVR